MGDCRGSSAAGASTYNRWHAPGLKEARTQRWPRRLRDHHLELSDVYKEVYLQRDPGEALDFCPIVANEEWLGRADLNDTTDAQFTELPEQLLNL